MPLALGRLPPLESFGMNRWWPVADEYGDIKFLLPAAPRFEDDKPTFVR